MSEVRDSGEVLSREELDALLASLAEEAAAAAPGAGPEGDERLGDEGEALRRAIEDFALRQSRHLSNVYQARVAFRLLRFARRPLGELLDVLLPSDRFAVVDFAEGRRGVLWLGRPLLFALLSLLFGARPGRTRGPLPTRPYTGIERRVYQRSAQEMLGALEDAWKGTLETDARVVTLEGGEWLRERRDERYLVASIDVRGLGDVCRLELALPEALVIGEVSPGPAAGRATHAALEPAVAEMPVDVHAELGSFEMSLAELARMRPGALIPLQAPDDGAVTVRIEGVAKFRGVRGSVGNRLAVQVTDRLAQGERGDVASG